jgi:hypothetical protein
MFGLGLFGRITFPAKKQKKKELVFGERLQASKNFVFISIFDIAYMTGVLWGVVVNKNVFYCVCPKK